ncbi:MAG TPA: ABC transporter permease, partial [Microbacterium ginsengisoli]|nr:ABC transporter permease [Microbacterium ginsengisoli]
LTIVTVGLAALFLFAPRDGQSVFRLSDDAAVIALGDVAVPSAPTAWITVAILALLTVWTWLDAAAYRRSNLAVPIVYAILAVFA